MHMNSKLTKVFLIFYFYILSCIVFSILIDFESWRTGSSNIIFLIYLLPAWGIIYIQLDIFLVLLPLLYYWYKSDKKSSSSLRPIGLIWLYLIFYFKLIKNAEFFDGENSGLEQIYLAVVGTKFFISLVISAIAIFRVVRSK